MSFIGQQINQQSLNGIIDLTDGTISIVDGDISNVKSLSINGEIDMNTNKIIDLKDGTNPGDAVNKAQLDAVSLNLVDYVRRDGTNSMTGNLNLNSNKIVNLATATGNGDAVNKLQMDSSLNLLRNYVNTQDTAERVYVDSSLNLFRSYVDIQDTTLRTYTDSSLNSLRTYVDTQDNLKVNKAGDTMTGNLLMSGGNNVRFNNDPASSDGASLTYATNFNELLLLVNSGATNRGFDLRVATGNPGSGSTRIWAQADGKVGINTRTPSEILDVNGNSKIRGFLDMSSNKISNLLDPSLAQDATTKNYVDTSLNLLRTYVDTQDSNDRTYVDSSLNLLRAYVDTQDTSIRTDVNSALNLKVDKVGGTLTGDLRLPMVRLIGQTVPLDFVVDEANKTNTYIYFEEAGATSDWALLRQIGGNDNVHLSLDFHNNTNDGAFSLRSVNSSTTPDGAPITFFSSNISQTTIKGLFTSDTLTVNGSALVNSLSVNNNLTVGGSLNITTGGNLKVGGNNGNQYQFLMSQGVNTPSWNGIGKEYKITISGALQKQYDNPNNGLFPTVVFESSSFTIDPYHSAVVHFTGTTGGYVSQLITGGGGDDASTLFFRVVSGSTIYYATTDFPWNGQRNTLDVKPINEFGFIYIPQSTSSRTFTLQLYGDVKTDDLYTVKLVDSVIHINAQPTYTTANLSIS